MTEKGQTNEWKSMTFRPTVLVADVNEMETALMDEAHMEGLVMQKCSAQDIRYSNAFMVATMKESENPTIKYHKIQDKVFFNAFSVICRKDCFCTEEKCRNNDAIAAEFLIEKKEEIENKPEYKNLTQIKTFESPDKQRKGIHYICPLTQLDEIALPVCLYDRQMGVLIVGQISTPENRANLEKCIRDQMSTNTKDQSAENAEDMIKRIHIEYHLSELITKIWITVDEIEKGLIERYVQRQNQYVLETSSQLIKELKKVINSENIKREFADNIYPAADHIERYEFIGKSIQQQLNTLCDIIGISSRDIFIPTHNNLVENNYNDIANDNATFHFGRWMEKNYPENICCEDSERYIDNGRRECDLLMVASASTYPIAMAVNSQDFLLGIPEPEMRLLKQTLCDTFYKFAEYAQMVGMEAKSDYYRVYLDTYMGIQRHELGQSNSGYQMLIEEFRKAKGNFLRDLNEKNVSPSVNGLIQRYIKDCNNFIANSDSYLHTTLIRIQSSKYLVDFSDMNKTYFYPYDAFLFKWKQIYGKKTELAGLSFDFPQVKFLDYTRPMMYGDHYMIEQAAYNLTNNAIKYAIPGTAVALDCCLSSDQKRYQIIVENIGRPLQNDAEADRIFDFGKRGSNNKKDGSGLGLFLTRQIAKAHGGDVFCETEKLSDYNWSLLRLYMEYYESRSIRNLCNDEELYHKLKQEWEIKRDTINKYVTKEIPHTAFTPMYVHMHIRSGTAKFKFTFWIPCDND